MKAPPRIAILAGLVMLLLCGVWFYIAQNPAPRAPVAETPPSATATHTDPSKPAPSPASTPIPEEEQQSSLKQMLTSIGAGMKKAGAQEMPAINEQLKTAVATKDHAEIVRAFHEAIYGRWQKMNEVLPAVRAYLSDADSFVQYTAARTLLTAGDRSGVETLLGIVTAQESIAEGKQDLRVEAARVLSKFREKEAAPGILQLYKTTSGSGLLSALATLQDQGVVAELQSQGFYSNKFSILRYGTLQIESFSPQIAAVFQQTTDPDLKNAAAWALARGGDQGSASYLAQAAQPAINAAPKGAQTLDASTEALRYLGSVQSPVAIPVLERALESNNPVAVQYAVVNLLFNQAGGSEKAKQIVLRELRGEQRKLGTELLLNIASKLDDPEIRAAGEAFDQRSGDRSWKLYSGERRQWPLYNWIDDYVVALNQ